MGCCSSYGSQSIEVDGREYFCNSGIGLKNEGKRLEGTGGTGYGAITIVSNKPNIHRWVFKISSGGGIFIIGIDEVSMKSIDKQFTPQQSHPNYGYFNGDIRNGGIYSYNIKNETIYGKGYGQTNHCNDTILMELNLSTSTLKYYLNDKSQGIAIRNIQTGNDIKYRMAVYMTKGKKDAVIEVFSYSCTGIQIDEKQKELVYGSQNNSGDDDSDSIISMYRVTTPILAIDNYNTPTAGFGNVGYECFFKSHSKTLVLSKDECIVTNPKSSQNTTIYGSVLTTYFDKYKNKIYKWKFKINGMGQTGFGIIESMNKNDIPPLDNDYDDFFYNKRSLKNYGIISNRKCSCCEYEQYGIEYGQHDIIEVILDYDGGYFSFCIDHKPQGNAFKVETNCSYRIAVSLYAGAEVELLSYNCINYSKK